MLGKVLSFAALILAAIVFQIFFSSLLSIDRIIPDIYVILVVYLTLMRGLGYGALFGFVCGLIESSMDPVLFGVSAVLKVILALIIYTFSMRLRLDSNFSQVLVVFISVSVHNLLFYLIAYNINIELVMMASIKFALLSAVYSAIVTVVLLYLSQRKLTLKFEA